ncbi:MAG TPA: HAMP domain-containing sensor histidine kinase [Terriglobales bacterium]|nr:HAMP domain-containing sensor histidine kinase [Terriglobales bacterium]
MKKRWRWNERTRLLLTLELAVVLPAAALIVANILQLEHIHRDHAIEALMQRDFSEALAISEKHISEKGYGMAEQVREAFPHGQEACSDDLDLVLKKYPFAAHAFYYSPHTGLIFRSRQARMDNADFRAESEDLQHMMIWLKMEYEPLSKKFRMLDKEGKMPAYFESNRVRRGDQMLYESVAYFLVPQKAGQEPALGGFVFDAEYLRDQFFPQALNSLMSSNLTEDKGSTNRAAVMVHLKGNPEFLAACTDWDGGKPEVERTMEGAFPGLVLAMKMRGTTLKAMGDHFVRMEFLILGGLSLLLAGGIFITYRNVNREMALARLKSDFVSNVSHELRTPLSLIRLYAETLELGRLTSQEKREEYYRIIRKESERLTALINNILDFSRIEAGRKEYEFRETDIAELVHNTLESYRYQIEQHGFTFEEKISDNLPPMRVDREAIARSLVNLVNNALKYSQKEKFLGVNLYRENGSVKLEVVDHGIGISRPEQPKIFEKFYRVGDPLVHNTKGSGLGLSLVRHIVEAHGGEVSVESTPGKGSKFVIALPVNSAAREARAAAVN